MALVFLLVYAFGWSWWPYATLVAGIPGLISALACSFVWAKQKEFNGEEFMCALGVFIFWPLWMIGHFLNAPVSIGERLRKKREERIEAEKQQATKMEYAARERDREMERLDKQLEREAQQKRLVAPVLCICCTEKQAPLPETYLVGTQKDRMSVCPGCLKKFYKAEVLLFNDGNPSGSAVSVCHYMKEQKE